MNFVIAILQPLLPVRRAVPILDPFRLGGDLREGLSMQIQVEDFRSRHWSRDLLIKILLKAGKGLSYLFRSTQVSYGVGDRIVVF